MARKWIPLDMDLVPEESGIRIGTAEKPIGEAHFDTIVVGGSPAGSVQVFGTRAAPQLITSGGGISSSSALEQLRFISGDGGAVNISVDPQIAVPSSVGQRMTLVGCSDSDTVLLEHGTGLELNGAYSMKDGSVLVLVATTTSLWTEVTRNDI